MFLPLLCTAGSALAVANRLLLAEAAEFAALRAPVANVFKLFIMADRREMVTWCRQQAKMGWLQHLHSLVGISTTPPIASSMTSISSFQQSLVSVSTNFLALRPNNTHSKLMNNQKLLVRHSLLPLTCYKCCLFMFISSKNKVYITHIIFFTFKNFISNIHSLFCCCCCCW